MPTLEELIESNPFPGLRPFATSEADRFFGRRQQIEEVLARLDAVSFVAVAGSSGCGKSSLVRAGVLSELERRRLAGGQLLWRAAVMRPGNQPIANLAEELARALGGSGASEESRIGSLYGRLRLGGLGLVEAVRLARLEGNVRVLVVADQFEEIFRYKRMVDADEASAFVKLLLNAAGDPQSPVKVVITLRSDSLGYCADFRDLPEAINRGQYLVPKLTREQRKEAIVNPVELRGHRIAPRLVQRVLNDVSDDFDDLPVMQHVLARTWNHWAGACQGRRPMDLEDYEAVGASKMALSNHADQAWRDLRGLESVTEKVFRALTEPGAEGTEPGAEGAAIRRPLDFKRLCAVVGADIAHVAQVVERFRRPDTGFLMPPRDVPLSDNPVIDISHESLIRQWERLRGWAAAEAESRAILVRLVDAARLHERDGGNDSLWRGPNLARALEWQRRVKPTDAWVGLYTGGDGKAAWQSAQEFLAASAGEADREQRNRRRLVRGLRGLAIAVVAISLIATFITLDLLRQAKSRDLASLALLVINDDPARGAHFAVAALDKDSANPRAEYALRQSLANLEIAYVERILDLKAPVSDMRYTRDGTRLVTASGNTVRLFDAKAFEELRTITREKSVLKAWLVADNTILVTHTRNDQVQIQPLESGSPRSLSCQSGADDFVYTVNTSPDERYVALGCSKGGVLVWDVAVADPTGPKHAYTHAQKAPITITALAFSADGQYLASGDTHGVVHVWKLGHPEPWIRNGKPGGAPSPIAHASTIRDLGFHPTDPGLLVSAADDAQAVVWHLDLERRRLRPEEKGQKARWSLRHERPVHAAKFAPRRDSNPLIRHSHPLITVSDKTVRIWVDETPDSRSGRGHDDLVNDANASEDGELLATASADGTALIWSTRSGGPIAILRGHRSGVSKAIFAPGGDRVATASDDGSVRIWRVSPPRVLWTSDKWMLSAAFAPGANRIAVGGEGQARTLDLTKGAGPNQGNVDFRSVDESSIGNLSWSRDGKWVAGSSDGLLASSQARAALWRAESGKEAAPEWLKKWSRAVFSAGTDELVTVGRDETIAVWDLKSLETRAAQPIQRLGGIGTRYLVAISPDGKWIATDGEERQALLWNRAEPGAPARKLEGHRGDITSLQFSRDGKWLVTASRDRTARIWPVERPGEPKVLKDGHTAALFSAAFDPNGERVITSGAAGTIRVWNVKTGHQLAALRWHAEGVNEVQFGPDGAAILSASDDGTVKLGRCEACNLTTEKLRERVHERARLSKPGLEEVQREIDAVKMRWMPEFLMRER